MALFTYIDYLFKSYLCSTVQYLYKQGLLVIHTCALLSPSYLKRYIIFDSEKKRKIVWISNNLCHM